MNKIVSTLAILSVLAFAVPSAYAWQYEGLNSLNPFTGFRVCNKCQKIKKQKCKCQKVKACPVVQKDYPCPCAIR